MAEKRRRRKKPRSEEYEAFRKESDERLRRTYAHLGFRNLPPLPIGADTSSPEYRAFRAEADERLREIREHLEREEAGT